MAEPYDLLVIGAGPGGYLPAIRAARMGKRTAVVEKEQLGGTCLNQGCIPTKTWLHASSLYREAAAGGPAGLLAPGLSVDAGKLVERKEQVLASLREGIEAQFKRYKIDLYRGTATVTQAHEVEVALEGTAGPSGIDDGTDGLSGVEGDTNGSSGIVGGTNGFSGVAGGAVRLEGKYILVSTGTKPAPLPIPGIDLPGVENSTTMLDRPSLYDHLVIIGGGVIGMEFAQIYSDLGKQVTVLEAAERILPGMDREISQNLKMIMKKRGVEIHTGASVQSITQTEDGKLRCIYMEKGVETAVCSDGILAAVGRKACAEPVFSEECKKVLKFDRGFIKTDGNGQTAIPGIYAAGDVTGKAMLAHAAAAQGYRAVSHMFLEDAPKTLAAVPSCVYTDPEIACVGLTADEAKSCGIETKTGKYLMSMNGKSVLSMQERGFIKLVTDAQTGRVLGAQLMCGRATDMIGELELAISKNLTVEDLARVVMAHPTFAEGIGEAAEELLYK